MFTTNRLELHLRLDDTFVFDEMPEWRRVLTLPSVERLEKLRDPAVREGLRAEFDSPGSRAVSFGWDGLEVETVDELERLGLLEGREAGTSVVYDGDALLVARVATRFAEHGFDVRHLRMYLVAAQREAGIIEQVLRPILREGDGRSRAEVRRLVDELSDAGAALHDLLLRRSLGPFG